MAKSKRIEFEYCFTKRFLFNDLNFLFTNYVGEKLEKLISKEAFQAGGLTLDGTQKDIKLLIKIFSALFFTQSLQNKESIFDKDSFCLNFYTKTTMSDGSTILFVWSFDIEKHLLARSEWEIQEGLEPFQCCELNYGQKVSSNILNVFSDQNRQKTLGDLCFLKQPRPIFNVRPRVSSYVVPPCGKTAEYIYTILYNRSIELDEILRSFSEPVPFSYLGFNTLFQQEQD